jgi:two-component system nitrogen regulation sensor histidine kinase GlnL
LVREDKKNATGRSLKAAPAAAGRPAPAPDPEHWLESLPSPVLGVDAGERVRFANAEAADLLAGVGRGLLGRRLSDVFGHDAPLVALVQRALKEGARVGDPDVSLSGPGFALGRASVIAAPVGERGYVGLVFQLQARARSNLGPPIQAAAARTLAHEVRNPLAGIRAAAQLIARGDDPDHRALASLICDEVDRVRRLTDRIDPRMEPPRFEALNIHEALDRVRKIVSASAPDVSFRESYDPSLPRVRGDLDQLIQAFLNIAKNAVEAVAGQDGGEVVFATAYRPGLRIRSGPSGAARAQLEVRIIDNGPGVHDAVADRLFEPFASTKSGGVGLGLTVAADIVARHDGRIEVDSAHGRTAFRILLPIDPVEDTP